MEEVTYMVIVPEWVAKKTSWPVKWEEVGFILLWHLLTMLLVELLDVSELVFSLIKWE